MFPQPAKQKFGLRPRPFTPIVKFIGIVYPLRKGLTKNIKSVVFKTINLRSKVNTNKRLSNL